jgi:MFS family permease
MLPLSLFRRRNFWAGNLETLTMYAGLSILFFFLILFVQQVGGYSPLSSGLAVLPTTIVMFVLSRRFGALADRYGPRLFMGAGPLVAAAGLLLLVIQVRPHIDYLTQLLPGLLLFSLGLSATVAPLTAAVLAGADEHQAGIASGVNNAIARVAGLLGAAAVGAVVAAQFSSALDHRLARQSLSPPARVAVAQAKRLTFSRTTGKGLPSSEALLLRNGTEHASLHSFRVGIGIAAGLVALGGVLGFAFVRNPQRVVRAEECSGGQIVGASPDAAGCHVPEVAVAEPATTG